MKTSLCVIHELARRIADDPSLRAVFLDADKRRVSFACLPGCDDAKVRQALEEVIRPFRPEDVPACATDPWRVDCDLCARGAQQAMPQGIRLITLPGAGVLLERESCTTAARFWKWRQFPWVKVQPIAITEAHGHEWKWPMALAVLCGLSTLSGFLIEKFTGARGWPALACYGTAYLSGSFFAALETWELLRKRILDIHFLMLAVAVGAAAIGHWWEGAVLMFLFSISGALEDLAMQRTEREINSLFKAAPRQATLRDEHGQERLVPVESIAAGMTLVVRPGEQFPVDAEVVEGTSASDESNLTGESVPVDKTNGDQVLAGTLNLWGRLDCRALKPATESALSKVIHLIQEARESKAPSQRFTDRFSSAYTYAILGASLVMLLVWWKLFHLPFEQAFYRTMTLLVVASPCALVLSIPSAVLAGVAAGARRGILFRGGAAIEKLAEVNRVALDKTGTLTTGELQIEAIHTDPPGQEATALQLAHSLEHLSTHPLARAINRFARHRGIDRLALTDFQSVAGSGLKARFDQQAVWLGRGDWVREESGAQISLPAHSHPSHSEVWLATSNLLARILLKDDVRPQSRQVLDRLRQHGIRTVLLTGDRRAAAQKLQPELGLDEIRAELRPEDKVSVIQHLTASGHRVAMVGDGVNDAPSLAAADVGVAMGARGSDAALEQAEIVLMHDRLENFLTAFELSRRARRIIRQNLLVSLGTVVLLVGCALTASIPLSLGVVGHEGSTVIVVTNSLRLLFFRPQSRPA